MSSARPSVPALLALRVIAGLTAAWGPGEVAAQGQPSATPAVRGRAAGTAVSASDEVGPPAIDPEVRRVLLQSLAGLAASAPDVRAEAARAAGRLHHPLFLHPIRGLLTAPEPGVRAAAAEALGELGVPPLSRDLYALVNALLEAGRDPDDHVSAAAIQALGRYPFPEVRLRLSKLAADPATSEARRQAARRALAGAGVTEAKERLSAWLDATAREAPDADPALEVAGMVRFGAPDQELVRFARDLLDPEPALRLPATRAIAAWADERERLPFLRRALADRAVEVRRVAADALARSTSQASALALDAVAADPDPAVRRAALHGLARDVTGATLPALAARLRDETDPQLRADLRALIPEQPKDVLLALLEPWVPSMRDEVRQELVPIAEAQTSTGAAELLAELLAASGREDVAARIALALEPRPDGQVVPRLLALLERSQPGTAARRRSLGALSARRDPRVAERGLQLLAAGRGDPGLAELLRARPEARAGLLALAESDDHAVRALTLAAIEPFRGDDAIDALVRAVERHPADDHAFRVLAAQEGEHLLPPMIGLLGSGAHAHRTGAILALLRGRRSPDLIEPVVASALATPDVAMIAIDVLREQDSARSLPALAQLAGSERLNELSRARALVAMGELGVTARRGCAEGLAGCASGASVSGVVALVRPLAKDPSIEVRMTARNVLHTLEPDVYPRWDPYGRVPLVTESALFGASMLLIASDIANANLSPAFTGAVGLVLGGATPYLLTLDEDVTLGDAGYFGTLALQGTLGGWGAGGALGLGEERTRWLTLGGQIAGLAVAGLTMKDAQWSLDEVALVNFAALEAMIASASLAGLSDGTGTSEGPSPGHLALLGGAVATIPMALLARRLELGHDLVAVGTLISYGAWLGMFAPGIVDPDDYTGGDAFLGFLAGQGAAFFAGLAVSQLTELSPRTAQLSVLGAAGGSAMLSGLGLALDLERRANFGLLEVGTVGGALALGLLAERLEFHDNDAVIVTLSTLGGLVAGGQLMVRAEEGTFGQASFPGGMMLGAGAGMFAGLVSSQLVDASDHALLHTLAGGTVVGAGGAGFGLLVPELGVRERSAITGAAVLAGLALTGPFAEDLRLEADTFAAMALGGAAGSLFGGYLPAYWHEEGEGLPARESGGGAVLGASLGLVSAAAISQSLELDAGELGLATLGGSAGAAIGAGLGLLVPAFDRRVTVAMMQGAGLAGLTGLTALAVSSVEPSLAADGSGLPTYATTFALHGALHGALTAYSFGGDAPTDEEVGGGILFGSGLGALGGASLPYLLDRPLDRLDLLEASLYSALLDGVGAGVGIATGDRRLGAGLAEGLGLAGLAAGAWLAPSTAWSGAQAPALALGTGAFGWLGGWLPALVTEDGASAEAAGGGALAGASLGLLLGAAYAQLLLPADESTLDVSFEAAAAMYAASGVGAGLGLLVPGIERRGTVALLESGGLLGLGVGLLAAPHTEYRGGDLALIGLTATRAGWHGAWVPALREGGLSGQAPGARGPEVAAEEVGGGLLLGSSLGLGTGMVLAQLLDPDPDDVLEAGLLAAAFDAASGGASLAFLGGARTTTALALQAGGALGLGIGALVAPATSYEANDAATISLLTALGAWHGLHLGRVAAGDDTGVSPEGRHLGGGALAGAAAGTLGGVLLTQLTELQPDETVEALVFAVAGNAMGGGLDLLLSRDLSSPDRALVLDAAGLSMLGLGLALAPVTRFGEEDRLLVGLGSGFGLWSGLWLPSLLRGDDEVISEREVGGAALFGLGLGATAAGALAQGVELDGAGQLEAGAAFVFASAAGAGAGLLAPGLGRRATAGLLEGAGLLGLAGGLALSPALDFDPGDLALVGLFSGAGLASGLVLPHLAGREDPSGAEAAGGGALLGAGAFGLGAMALAQVTDHQPDDVAEEAGTALVGTGLGLGLSMMIPGTGGRSDMGLASGVGLLALASSLAFAPVTDYSTGDHAMGALGAGIGGLLGGLAPVLWVSAEDGVEARQAGGGVLFGSALGLASGLALAEIAPASGTQREHAALGAAVGALSGSGIGLLASTDDRLAVSLLEGLTLAGAVGVGLTGPDADYDAGDLAFGAAYVSYLTWHSLGLTLLLEGTDRQAGGAAMATVGLGALTGMYVSPYIDLDLGKVLTLFAGNVWGTWIGGWGGAMLRDSTGALGDRQDAGLTLVSTVAGSDVGLALTGLVVAGLVDVEPTRFAVINLSGLAGMMVGMLVAGFAQDEPLRAGNVLGSLGGLTLGTVVTAFIDFRETPTWDELLASGEDGSSDPGIGRPVEPSVVTRSAASPAPELAHRGPITVESWFPSARVEPGPDGEERYLFSVIGTWD